MRHNCCAVKLFRHVKKIHGIRLIWKWKFGKDFVITAHDKPTMATKFQ